MKGHAGLQPKGINQFQTPALIVGKEMRIPVEIETAIDPRLPQSPYGFDGLGLTLTGLQGPSHH